VAKLDQTGAGALAAQNLREYYSVITRPRFGVSREQARADIAQLDFWVDDHARTDNLRAASALQDRYKLSFLDCLLLAAAQASACDLFLSEDMQHGMDVDGVMILNPFLPDAGPFFDAIGGAP
jgi:predicted nucleic acid-binding protein